MDKAVQPNKPHHARHDYTKCIMTCNICKKIVKQKKSKCFSNGFALKYHLVTCHDRQDEIISGITKAEILKAVEGVTLALKLDMLVDLSGHGKMSS